MTDIPSLEDAFVRLADALLNRFAVQRGDKIFYLVDIEFFHNLTDKADGAFITYPE